MPDRPSLSYVMATFNKLPYLRVVMSRLLEAVGADEEIVIADGGSTDGTVEYLRSLHGEGKLHKYLSERDKGEAHALNKAVMLSSGELIKPVTDDDVFHWPSIADAKRFMLEHPEVDVLGGHNAYSYLGPGGDTIIESWLEDEEFKRWLATGRAFPFTGQSLMIRRKSLPLVGLFGTTNRHVDLEFAFRVTRAGNLAWYTGITGVRVHNPHSAYQTESDEFYNDRWKLFDYYNYRPPLRRTLLYCKIRMHHLRAKIGQMFSPAEIEKPAPPDEASFAEYYCAVEKKLFEHNLVHKGEFLYRGDGQERSDG